MTGSSLLTRVRRLEEEMGALVAQHGRTTAAPDFSRYAEDPVGFLVEVLRDTPWTKQVEIAEAVRDAPRVTVPSCNSAGKDHLAARLALWWVYARNGFVLITGPTDRQVKHIVMGHVHAAFAAAADLPGELYEMALRVGRTKQRGLLAFTSTAGDVSKLSGFHAPRLLVIVTEAQGVEAAVYEGVYACAAGDDSRILLLGNPLEPTGKFYEACSSPRWRRVRISAFDHPNLREQRNVIPGGITQAGVDQFAAEYGVDSPIYKARVLGEFSTSLSAGLVERPWLDAAAERFRAGTMLVDAWRDGHWQAGLDVARFGRDLTALAVRQGPVLHGVCAWGKLDLIATCDRVPRELTAPPFRLRRAKRLTDAEERIGVPVELRPPDGPFKLVVDEVGVGAGVVDELVRRQWPIVPFNGGRTPPQGPDSRFANWRASSFWDLRQLLELNLIAMPFRAQLVEELVQTRYLELPSGKLAIEPKADLQARIGRSPDEADAVCMAYLGYYRRPGQEWVHARVRI